MYAVSDEYLEVVKGDARVFPTRCKFDGLNDYITNKNIRTGSYTNMIDGNSILSMGNACSNKIEMTLINITQPYIWKGARFTFEKGLVVNGATEWVPWGTFWVTDMDTSNNKRTINLTAYDYMYQLSKMPYKTELVAPFHYRDLLDEFLRLAGMTLNVTVELPEADDEDYMILSWPEGEYSFADIAGHLAGMVCCNARVSWADPSVMEFTWYTPTATKIHREIRMGGFEKLADSPLYVDILATGANREIVIKNTNGSTAGALDFSQFDIPAAEDLPMFTFEYDTAAGTASCALNDAHKDSTDKMYIPTAVVYQGVVCYITSIPQNGFSGCAASKIILPNRLQNIGRYAFSGCPNITEITIPESVTAMNLSLFKNCSSLTTIYVNATNCQYAYSSALGVFSELANDTTVVFGSGVTTIPANCFRESDEVVQVIIPEGVTSIAGTAFYMCTKLQGINIPNSVTSIGRYAFAGCDSMKRVQVGTSAACQIASIHSQAFASSLFKNESVEDFVIYAAADSISGAPWGCSKATITWMLEG